MAGKLGEIRVRDPGGGDIGGDEGDRGATDFRRIGRLNKNRGRAFERKVAQVLGWTRVPYSGGMGAEWGRGDVIDGFYARRGYWLAECKTQPAGTGNVSVLDKWVRQIAKVEERHPLIATTLYGSPEAFIFLPRRSWLFLARAAAEARGQLYQGAEIRTRSASHGNGFCVRRTWIDRYWAVPAVRINVFNRTGDITPWWMMRLGTFAGYVRRWKCWVDDG